MFRGIGTLALVIAALLALSRAAVAADVSKGAQLATQWCANCHVIDGSGSPTVQQGPPSFRSIGLTGDQLRTFLAHPHGAMPDLALSRTEIDDVTAYIETLRH
jgi:mono/diheme cytochrome c family protein